MAAAVECAHKNPPPDFAYDHTASFASLRSYAWSDDPRWTMPQGNSIVDGQFIDRNVRADVDAVLQKKGYRKIERGDPNFCVAYHTDAAAVLSQDSYAVYNWSGPIWLGDEHVNAAQNEEAESGAGGRPQTYVGYSGTKYRKQWLLVLDIRDGQKKLVWRGARTATAGTNPKEIARDIQKAVHLLLSRFPPTFSKEAR